MLRFLRILIVIVIDRAVGGGLSPDCGEAVWKIGG